MGDFENELGEMLKDRVAGMPHEYDATPSLVARARRRRASKLTALVTAVVVVATGTTAAVAAVVDHHGSERLVTAPESSTSTSSTTVSRPSVPTVACPITYSLTPDTPLPAPSSEPRRPTAGDPAQLGHLTSFAATTDPRYVVLGPTGWNCEATIAADGQNGITVSPPESTRAGGISIINDFLWHGGVGSTLACSVFDDPALVQYLTQTFPSALPCPRAQRTVTKVNSNVSTFVDADGTRGVGIIVLPSSGQVDDGRLSILTCTPTTGLTAAGCDTIIADWIARNDSPG
jgi:hypothetical protein